MSKRIGHLIKILCLDKFNLSITDAAKILGIGRPHLSSLVNGKFSISAEMAIRLEQVFNTDAKAWLQLQLEYDLAEGREIARKKGIKLTQITKKKIRVPKNI